MKEQTAAGTGLFPSSGGVLFLLLPLLLLLLSPLFLPVFRAGAGEPVDIPQASLGWLRLSADRLFEAGDNQFRRSLEICVEMGWSEKEFLLRETLLARGGLTGSEREEEKRRLALLAIRTGRDEKAVELLDPWRTDDPEAVIAAGLAALRSGNYLEASRLLRAGQALGAPEPELVRFRLAQALRHLPDEDHGLPLFLEIAGEKGGRYRKSALYEAALLLFDRDRPSEATALLAGMFGEKQDDLVHRELIYKVALQEAGEGNTPIASRLYKRLLERWPEHRRALASFRALRRMEETGSIPGDDRLPLLGARAARSAGRTSESVQLLRPLLDRDESDPLHQEALIETGKTHYGAERYRSALTVFDRLTRLEGEKGRIALLYRARSFKKMGEWESSIEAYSEYIRRYPGSSLSPEVQWEISWRWRMLGRYEEAISGFRKLRTLFPSSEFAPRTRLQEAFCLDMAGRPDEAKNVLHRLVRSGGGGRDRDDALFWIGELADRDGGGEESAARYRELVDEFPETYYGLRAAGRLGEKSLLPIRPIDLTGESQDRALAWIRSWNGVGSDGEERDWGPLPLLVALGEWDEARKEGVRLRKKVKNDPEGLLMLGRLFRKSTLYDNTIRCGRRLQELAEASGGDPVHPVLLSLIYPPGYLDLVVERTGPDEDLDPFFVLALIRQESWFRSDAVSPAGARGLMQLMPATGKHVARRLGEGESFRTGQLFDPRRNIRYGTWYLRSLLDRYQGDRLVAASAYNAGEGNADLWLAGTGPAEEGGYVERIYFSETRDYVKRVLSGYWICRSLYGGAATAGGSG